MSLKVRGSFLQVILRDISPSHQRVAKNWNVWSLLENFHQVKEGLKDKGEMRKKCNWQRMQALGFKNQRPEVTGRVSNGSLRHWKVDKNGGEIKIHTDGEVQ